MFAYCANNLVNLYDPTGQFHSHLKWNSFIGDGGTGETGYGKGGGSGIVFDTVLGYIAQIQFFLWNTLQQGVEVINEWGQELQLIFRESEKQFEFGKCLEFAQRNKMTIKGILFIYTFQTPTEVL